MNAEPQISAKALFLDSSFKRCPNESPILGKRVGLIPTPSNFLRSCLQASFPVSESESLETTDASRFPLRTSSMNIFNICSTSACEDLGNSRSTSKPISPRLGSVLSYLIVLMLHKFSIPTYDDSLARISATSSIFHPSRSQVT